MAGDPLVYVGAQHWMHADWRVRFYPDDLPDDWLLSYYNTQFQVVYLPTNVWEVADEAVWAQWLHDTQEGFVFLLEPGGGETRPPASARVRLAEPAWSAAHIWWLEDAPDLRALAQRIGQHAQRGEPLFVLSRVGDLAALNQVNTLRQVMGY